MKKIIITTLLSTFCLSSIIAMEEETTIKAPKQLEMAHHKKNPKIKFVAATLATTANSYCHNSCSPIVGSCGPQLLGTTIKWLGDLLFIPSDISPGKKMLYDCGCTAGCSTSASILRICGCPCLSLICDGIALASTFDIIEDIYKETVAKADSKKEN